MCKCCMCFWFPAGDDGNNDLHLWHDGPVHLTQCARWIPLRACGEILPGMLSLQSTKTNPLASEYILLHFWHFLENGSEQRWSGDNRWIHRNLPKGKGIITPTSSTTWWEVRVNAALCFPFSTGWKYNGFHAALWERHLDSVDGLRSGMLHSASSCKLLGLKQLQSSLEKGKNWVMQHIWHILIQSGEHFYFSCRAVLCRKI